MRRTAFDAIAAMPGPNASPALPQDADGVLKLAAQDAGRGAPAAPPPITPLPQAIAELGARSIRDAMAATAGLRLTCAVPRSDRFEPIPAANLGVFPQWRAIGMPLAFSCLHRQVGCAIRCAAA